MVIFHSYVSLPEGTLLHRLNQQSTRNKVMVRTHPMSRRFSQITGQHWRMMSSLFLSTGAVQLVPGALIRRGVLLGTSHGFCWIILPSGKLT